MQPSTDVTVIERTVKAALTEAVVKMTWSQTGGFRLRDSHVIPQQPTRIGTSQDAYSVVTPSGHNNNQQNVYNAASQQVREPPGVLNKNQLSFRIEC